MNILIFILVLLSTCVLTRQHEDFPVGGRTTNTFKGLPKLPEINLFAGETRYVIYHEQLFALIDVTISKQLINCELIEAYETKDFNELYQNLSISYPVEKVEFLDMMAYMQKCDSLDNNSAYDSNSPHISLGSIVNSGSLSVFSRIVPGTKWCGAGDAAKSYRDLGQLRNIDRCCRAHDLCPIKVRGYSSRYNISNQNSFISKSHCTCDEIFYQCLKNINSDVTNVVGQIYFNYIHPPCIEDAYPNTGLKKLVATKRPY